MNAYAKAQQLGLTGTDAEKVAVLQMLTVSDIRVDAVRVWLRENLLWFRTSPTTMGGAIQVVLESPQTPAETKQQLGLFWSAVFGDGAQNLLTTVPTWAGLVWQIIQGLTQAAPDAAALVDSFYALDGGRPYKDLTVEQFAAERAEAIAAAESAAVMQSIRTRLDAAWNQIGTSEQPTAVLTLRQIADELETA
jgi:hypothetical protein